MNTRNLTRLFRRVSYLKFRQNFLSFRLVNTRSLTRLFGSHSIRNNIGVRLRDVRHVVALVVFGSFGNLGDFCILNSGSLARLFGCVSHPKFRLNFRDWMIRSDFWLCVFGWDFRSLRFSLDILWGFDNVRL